MLSQRLQRGWPLRLHLSLISPLVSCVLPDLRYPLWQQHNLLLGALKRLKSCAKC